MDCRTFREHHCAFIDDTLPASDVVAMECHRQECAECARLDTCVRRSLLLVRNLPPIECSSDFGERLFARLRETEVDRRPVLTARTPGLGTFAAVAAGILVVAFGALSVLEDEAPASVIRLQPLVATQGAQETRALPDSDAVRAMEAVLDLERDPTYDPLTSSAILATSAAGVPAWPAVILADEMPMHAAQAGFRMYSASW